MSHVNLNNLFGLGESAKSSVPEEKGKDAGCVNPILSHPLIIGAMAKDYGLLIQLLDHLAEAVDMNGDKPFSVDFTVNGIDVTYETENKRYPLERLSFHLGNPGSGLRLDCYCQTLEPRYGPQSEIWFEFSYNGREYDRRMRHWECVSGEPLAEQIPLPGFLQVFANVRLEDCIRKEDDKTSGASAGC